MKNPHHLDLYSDYLMSSFSLTTATGLSNVIDNKYSHDQITRFLEQDQFDQKEYWKLIKSVVREAETEDSVLIVDDFIEEKPHTTMNTLVCYHFDHKVNRSIKGINIVNFLLYTSFDNQTDVSIPVAFEPVFKTLKYVDKNTGKDKRKSETTKNEILRNRLKILVHQNHVKFRYALWDTWYSSAENMEFVVNELNKHFVCAIKDNRTVALSKQDKLKGKFVQVSTLDLKPGEVRLVWIKGVNFPVILAKQVYKNIDDSTGELFLVSSDTALIYEQITTIYKKRWKVEESHKSLKQNASLEKSPTKMEKTQMNHIFAAYIAYIKLESLKLKNRLNHFALKSKIYISAIKNAMQELLHLKDAIKCGDAPLQLKMCFE
jgi:hypothetical protein